MVRAVLYIFAAIVLISLLRSILGALAKVYGALFDPQAQARAGAGAEPRKAGELKRDPVCGTYVSTAVSVQKTVQGQVVHFCSTACSERYKG
jgi:YHS domain-containing protein